MAKGNIYNSILDKASKGNKQLALLVDPDKADQDYLIQLCTLANSNKIDLILIGGSLLTDGDLAEVIRTIKEHSNIPCLLFPGSASQINDQADGILFLSLLSSRNPEMLIGQQVVAAPYLRKTKLEVIPTAYLLIDSGAQTTASYISNSNPIPADKPEIAASTALAGEYLGMGLTYLDGGSGAKKPVPKAMIEKVKSYTSTPLIIGGGINDIERLKDAFQAGADIVVIGSAIEKNADLMNDFAQSRSLFH